MAETLDIVRQLALEGASHFHASYVAKETGHSIKAAQEALESLRVEGIVDVHFEVICPESDRTIQSFQLGEVIPYGEMFYEKTGDCEPFELTEKDILVTYSPSQSFLLRLNREEKRSAKKKIPILHRLWQIASTRSRPTRSDQNRRSSSSKSRTARAPRSLRNRKLVVRP